MKNIDERTISYRWPNYKMVIRKVQGKEDICQWREIMTLLTSNGSSDFLKMIASLFHSVIVFCKHEISLMSKLTASWLFLVWHLVNKWLVRNLLFLWLTNIRFQERCRLIWLHFSFERNILWENMNPFNGLEFFYAILTNSLQRSVCLYNRFDNFSYAKILCWILLSRN